LISSFNYNIFKADKQLIIFPIKMHEINITHNMQFKFLKIQLYLDLMVS